MKKLFVILLSALLLSATACGEEKKGDTKLPSNEITEAVTSETEVVTSEEKFENKKIIYGEKLIVPARDADYIAPKGYMVYEFDFVGNSLHYVHFASIATSSEGYSEHECKDSSCDECSRYNSRLKAIEAYCLKTMQGEALEKLKSDGISEEWVEKYGKTAWKRSGGKAETPLGTDKDVLIDEYLKSIGETELVGRQLDLVVFNKDYGFTPKEKSLEDYENEAAYIEAEFGGDKAAYDAYKTEHAAYQEALSAAMLERNLKRERLYLDKTLEEMAEMFNELGIQMKVLKFESKSVLVGYISEDDKEALATLPIAGHFVNIPQDFTEEVYNYMLGITE